MISEFGDIPVGETCAEIAEILAFISVYVICLWWKMTETCFKAGKHMVSSATCLNMVCNIQCVSV